jgi:hypothetical protein
MIFPSREFMQREAIEAIRAFYAPFSGVFEGMRQFFRPPAAEMELSQKLSAAPPQRPVTDFKAPAMPADYSPVAYKGPPPAPHRKALTETEAKPNWFIDAGAKSSNRHFFKRYDSDWQPTDVAATGQLPFLDWQSPASGRDEAPDTIFGTALMSKVFVRVYVAEKADLNMWVNFRSDVFTTSQAPTYVFGTKSFKLIKP